MTRESSVSTWIAVRLLHLRPWLIVREVHGRQCVLARRLTRRGAERVLAELKACYVAGRLYVYGLGGPGEIPRREVPYR